VTTHSNRTATVLFTDLVGSTELLSRLGESTFDDLRRAHFAALRTSIEGTGGTEVKTTGDGLLATFSSAADAVGCAVRMQQAVDDHRRTAGVPLAIRIGLSLGDVTFEDGDVFGTPVVEAAPWWPPPEAVRSSPAAWSVWWRAAAVRPPSRTWELAGAPPDDTQRMHLLISRGKAQRRASQPAYRETLLTAAAMAKRQNDPETLARAALAHNRGIFSRSLGIDRELVTVLESALAMAKPGDTPTRARLLADLASELAFSADHKRRQEAATEALAVARRIGDQATLGHVLVQRSALLLDDFADYRKHIAELTAAATRLGDPALAFWAALYGSQAALALGDASGHGRGMFEAGRCAGELGQPFPRYLVTALRSVQHRIAGRLEDAEAMARQALELGQTFGVPDSFRIYRAHIFGIRHDQGRLDTLADRLQRAAVREHQASSTLVAVALAFCELGRNDEARAVFDRIALDEAALPANVLWIHGMTMAAEVCAGLGDVGRAAVLSERLAPYRELMAGTIGGTLGAVVHHLGLLATTLGRFDEAERHFAAAATMHERLGAPTLLARTRLEWAHMLLVRREAGDAERARRFLGHALITARELGLGNVERRAVALLDSSSGKRAVASGTDLAEN
jgi:tetratricopeptide (TPR) repeat protein